MTNKFYEIEKIAISKLDESAVQHLFFLDYGIGEKYQFLPQFRNSADYKKLYLSQFSIPDNELFTVNSDKEGIIGILSFVKTADWGGNEQYKLTVRLCETAIIDKLIGSLRPFIDGLLEKFTQIAMVSYNRELDEMLKEYTSKYAGKIQLKSNAYTLSKKDIDLEKLNKTILDCEAKNPNLQMVYMEGISEEYVEQYCDLFMETMKDMPDNQEAGYVPYVITPDDMRKKKMVRAKVNSSHHCYMIFDRERLIAKTNVSVNNKDPRFPHQFMIGVLKEYRGRGLGKWLQACLYKQLAQTVDFEQILVQHHPENQPAIALSEWIGYKFSYFEVMHILKNKDKGGDKNEMDKIITERLELRRFNQADKVEYVKILTNPDVYRYLGDGTGATPEFAEKILTIYSFSRGIFAVVEKESGQLIGHCGIRPIPDGRIELLYAYAPEAWGKGYGTEAGKAILEYGKAHFEIDEIIAMAYPENPSSIAIMKKLGFERLGQEEHFGNMLEVYSKKMG